jgi:hypothetical protein
MFVEGTWFAVRGSGAVAHVGENAIYLVISVRNAGSGIAVLHGWHLWPQRRIGRDDHPSLDGFTPLSRDLYVPVGDVGFWQGAFRDPADPAFAEARAAIDARQPMSVDLLYGDLEGGQRAISRFGLTPRGDGDEWLASVVRHWNVDRADPR